MIIRIIYSYRNASTGFLVAARQLCQLTVKKVIASANNPANANIHQLKSVLYAKDWSHLFIAYQDIGVASTKERAASFSKSLLSINITSETFAPLILRIPI